MVKQRSNMRDVAHAAKVSVSSVSLVVRGMPGVGAETRERVWAAIADLGYTPPAPTSNGKSHAVALLIEKNVMPVILDVFYGDILRGFQSEAQRLGYQVLLHMYDAAADTVEGLKASLPEEAQGLVIANDGDITPQVVSQLQALGVPMVLIEAYVPGQKIPCVLGDNFSAGYTIMRHMLALGHRSIAILQGSPKYSSLVDRLRGCLAAAEEEGVLIPRAYLPQPVSGHPKRGYLEMREILRLEARPTAVIAINDKRAFSAIEAIKETPLRIPHDIALASIDDVTESAYTVPPLTTVHIPRQDIGILAMQKLHRLINHDGEIPAKSVVYGELVVRDSCGSRLGLVATGGNARPGVEQDHRES